MEVNGGKSLATVRLYLRRRFQRQIWANEMERAMLTVAGSVRWKRFGVCWHARLRAILGGQIADGYIVVRNVRPLDSVASDGAAMAWRQRFFWHVHFETNSQWST